MVSDPIYFFLKEIDSGTSGSFIQIEHIIVCQSFFILKP